MPMFGFAAQHEFAILYTHGIPLDLVESLCPGNRARWSLANFRCLLNNGSFVVHN
jgi:hypothetical protein